MSYSFVRNSVNDQTSQETQLIATYELAKVVECIEHATTHQKEAHDYAKTETADFVTMCRMLCEQELWLFDDMSSDPVDTLHLHHDAMRHLAKMQIFLGKTIRGLMYLNRYGEPRGDHPQASMKMLVGWTRRFCKHMGWDFWEVCDLGEELFKARMRDLTKTGIECRLRPQYRRHRVTPDLGDALAGTTLTPGPAHCGQCLGSGQVRGGSMENYFKPCPACHGSGLET